MTNTLAYVDSILVFLITKYIINRDLSLYHITIYMI